MIKILLVFFYIDVTYLEIIVDNCNILILLFHVINQNINCNQHSAIAGYL